MSTNITNKTASSQLKTLNYKLKTLNYSDVPSPNRSDSSSEVSGLLVQSIRTTRQDYSDWPWGVFSDLKVQSVAMQSHQPWGLSSSAVRCILVGRKVTFHARRNVTSSPAKWRFVRYLHIHPTEEWQFATHVWHSQLVTVTAVTM